MKSELNTAKLGEMVKLKRGNMGLRMVAEEIGGITAPTLSRIERGNLPDVDSFLKICKWLQVPPDIFTLDHQSSDTFTKNHRKEIHAHLRADKNLPKEAADYLIQMVELAYKSLGNKKIK
jgi:transcriptional regulator with XRE-family HTH domain